MCTLTIQRTNERILMTMNRDEKRVRPNELEPFLWDNPKIFAPQDAQAHGTWIGANEKNEIAALLNGYQENDNQQAVNSRGEIIPKILSGQDINPENYNSFHLVYINDSQIKHSVWDGKNFEEGIMPDQEWVFFTSSSYKQTEVKKQRFDEFEKWKQGLAFIQTIPSIHRQHSSDQKAHSVLMERDDACTKSITQFDIGSDQKICRYWAKPHENQVFLEYKGLF